MRKDTPKKIILYVFCDIIFVVISLLGAVALWYAGFLLGEGQEAQLIPAGAWWWLLWISLIGMAINTAVLAGFRLYNHLWRYAGIDELLKIFAATFVVIVALFLVDFVVLSHFPGLTQIPRRIFVAAWFILFLLTVFSRLGERILRRLIVTLGHMLSRKTGLKRVMVIGAGFAGYDLIRGMLNSPVRERIPVLLVDDDPAKNNAHMMGVRIVNGVADIPYLAAAHKIDEITVAIPSADNAALRRILEHCTQTDCRLTIVPPVSEVSGVPGIREVSIGDLLYRDEVKLNTENIQAYIEGACVMVTGGGGSIGAELCRQLIRYNPRQILIVDIYENNAFELVQALNEKNEKNEKNGSAPEIIFRVASIRDKPRMDELFRTFRPDVVFHAAAHKHVSTMEDSPAEAVKNNVFGTLNVIRAAIAHDTGRFVLISSDKAVRPTNIYGATKRVTELVMQREAFLNKGGKTLLSAVRFGNVLGSHGSIIPKLKRQIARGGPVTVYNKKAERFFMTISEACQLVLQAGGLSVAENNGPIFILDMGKPVNIDDLVRKMIRLSGYRPDEEIEIIYTALQPGEKLAEELILPEEKIQNTFHEKIWVAPAIERDYAAFDAQLDRLRTFAMKSPERIAEALKGMELHYTTCV